jgi:polysaccharide biosynthesis transport protein
MRDLLDDLAKRYDYIVLDSAPVAPVSDSVALSSMVDAVVIVVGAQTPKQIVQNTCTRLNHVGARMLGLVLNRVDTEHSVGYHYYNHYYSNGYGHQESLS